LAERFHDRHHILNGFSRPDQPIELVTLRAAAISRPALEWASLPVAAERGEALIGRREVSDGVSVDRWWRPYLRPGIEVVGPAVVEESESTTWIGDHERAAVLEDGTLQITW
jgi:N-methylhydantoinase A/oxoprolinase/acetone carboxylase beta subunit